MMRYGLSGTWRSFTTAGGGPAAGHACERAPPPQPPSAMTMPLSTTTLVGAATCMGYLPLSETASSDGAPRARSRCHLRRLVEVLEAGGGWWRLLRHALHHPPPLPPSSTALDPNFQRIPRSLRPPVPALQRCNVQGHRRQVVEQDRPWGERTHRGEAFHV